jgi:hypothetical protein
VIQIDYDYYDKKKPSLKNRACSISQKYKERIKPKGSIHQRYSDKESPIKPPSSPSMRWSLKFLVTTSRMTDSLNLSVLNKA